MHNLTASFCDVRKIVSYILAVLPAECGKETLHRGTNLFEIKEIPEIIRGKVSCDPMFLDNRDEMNRTRKFLDKQRNLGRVIHQETISVKEFASKPIQFSCFFFLP